MKNTKSLITVYITNYNYGDFIEQSIQSVLNQTYDSYEIIIIDDGSTDNSKEIIQKYERHGNITVIYQENKGLTISNNIAISVARGKYIMRLDADDYLDPNALYLLHNEFEKDETLGMAFGDWYEVDEFNNVIAIERRHNFDKEVSILDQPAHGACTMFRVSFLKEINGYDESLTRQDGYDLWFRFVNSYKIKSINVPIFYYRKHGLNLTSDETKLLNVRSKILEKYGRSKAQSDDILSIIPIRGSEIDVRSQPFLKIGDKNLIDYTIDALKEVKNIKTIIITTPDKNVIDYIQSQYTDTKIICIYRDPPLARINSNLVETIRHCLLSYSGIESIKSFFISTIETPFKRPELLQSAINIKNIFDVDTVVGVRSVKDMLFKHDGNGLISLTNNQSLLRLERDQLHQYVTGFTLCDLRQFLYSNQIFSGKIGHISIDQRSAFTIRSEFDLNLANFLVKANL
jgi:glycosyltransferase involved in cell wall biosynthesis